MKYSINIKNGSSSLSKCYLKGGVLTIPISLLCQKSMNHIMKAFIQKYFTNKYISNIKNNGIDIRLFYEFNDKTHSFPENEIYRILPIYENEHEFWIRNLALPDCESWSLTLELEEKVSN